VSLNTLQAAYPSSDVIFCVIMGRNCEILVAAASYRKWKR